MGFWTDFAGGFGGTFPRSLEGGIKSYERRRAREEEADIQRARDERLARLELERLERVGAEERRTKRGETLDVAALSGLMKLEREKLPATTEREFPELRALEGRPLPEGITEPEARLRGTVAPITPASGIARRLSTEDITRNISLLDMLGGGALRPTTGEERLAFAGGDIGKEGFVFDPSIMQFREDPTHLDELERTQLQRELALIDEIGRMSDSDMLQLNQTAVEFATQTALMVNPGAATRTDPETGMQLPPDPQASAAFLEDVEAFTDYYTMMLMPTRHKDLLPDVLALNPTMVQAKQEADRIFAQFGADPANREQIGEAIKTSPYGKYIVAILRAEHPEVFAEEQGPPIGPGGRTRWEAAGITPEQAGLGKLAFMLDPAMGTAMAYQPAALPTVKWLGRNILRGAAGAPALPYPEVDVPPFPPWGRSTPEPEPAPAPASAPATSPVPEDPWAPVGVLPPAVEPPAAPPAPPAEPAPPTYEWWESPPPGSQFTPSPPGSLNAYLRGTMDDTTLLSRFPWLMP